MERDSVKEMRTEPLIFSFDYPPLDGGISRLCSEIASGLAKSGATVRVLTGAAGEAASSLPEDNQLATPSIARVGPGRPWREIASFRHLRTRPSASVVICGLWYPEALIAALSGCKSLIVLAHGAELMPTRSWARRRIWKQLLRWTLGRASLVLADSSYTRRNVEQIAPTAKVTALPLAVDHQRFTPGDRDAARARFRIPDKRVVLSVSRICRFKGHDLVFRALEALPPDVRSELIYVIAGQGPDRRSLELEAEALGLSQNVRWLGYVREDDLPYLYRAADLFTLCTREIESTQEVEGFGLVFLEAQACAIPVIGTRTGGIEDAVREGEGGWLIPQDDLPGLTNVLKRLILSPAEFAKQGLAGRSRVERECTWGQYLRRFKQLVADRGIELV